MIFKVCSTGEETESEGPEARDPPRPQATLFLSILYIGIQVRFSLEKEKKGSRAKASLKTEPYDH